MNDNSTMSTMDWFFTLLVLAIPGVNLILYLVWACGAGNRNRVNFCRASILWFVVIVAIYGIIFGLAGFASQIH